VATRLRRDLRRTLTDPAICRPACVNGGWGARRRRPQSTRLDHVADL